MGMCLAMCTLSDENIRRVLADPPLIWKVIAPDDPEACAEARKQRGGPFAKLFGRRTQRAPTLTWTKRGTASTTCSPNRPGRAMSR
jgi:hypothetical protein